MTTRRDTSHALRTAQPPSRGTRRYAAIAKRGCGGRKTETIDGTDYDCDYYLWECDNCPVCVEAQRNRAKGKVSS